MRLHQCVFGVSVLLLVSTAVHSVGVVNVRTQALALGFRDTKCIDVGIDLLDFQSLPPRQPPGDKNDRNREEPYQVYLRTRWDKGCKQPRYGAPAADLLPTLNWFGPTLRQVRNRAKWSTEGMIEFTRTKEEDEKDTDCMHTQVVLDRRPFRKQGPEDFVFCDTPTQKLHNYISHKGGKGYQMKCEGVDPSGNVFQFSAFFQYRVVKRRCLGG